LIDNVDAVKALQFVGIDNDQVAKLSSTFEMWDSWRHYFIDESRKRDAPPLNLERRPQPKSDERLGAFLTMLGGVHEFTDAKQQATDLVDHLTAMGVRFDTNPRPAEAHISRLP
jgi:hypothetical protein